VKQAAAIQKRQSSVALSEPENDSLADDPRWALTQRVVAGPHFVRSSLLSNFLLYVVSETLAGRCDAISEHKIGVNVFGRSVSYRTDEDNIVRNYARQLRKRLAEHFSEIGRDEPLHIDIPVGGYVPSFVNASFHLAEVEPKEPISVADYRPGNLPAEPPTVSGPLVPVCSTIAPAVTTDVPPGVIALIAARTSPTVPVVRLMVPPLAPG